MKQLCITFLFLTSFTHAYLVQEVIFTHPKTNKRISLYADVHTALPEHDEKQSALILERIPKFLNSFDTIIYFEGYLSNEGTIDYWKAEKNPIRTIDQLHKTKSYNTICPVDCRAMNHDLEQALMMILFGLPCATNYQQLLSRIVASKDYTEDQVTLARELIEKRIIDCDARLVGSCRSLQKKMRVPAQELMSQSRKALADDVISYIVDPHMNDIKSQIDQQALPIALRATQFQGHSLLKQKLSHFLSSQFSATTFFQKRGITGEAVFDFFAQSTAQISHVMDYNFILHVLTDDKSESAAFMGAYHVYYISQLLKELGYTCAYNSRVTVNGVILDFASTTNLSKVGKFNTDYTPLSDFKSLLQR